MRLLTDLEVSCNYLSIMAGARLSIEDLDTLGDEAQTQIRSKWGPQKPRHLKYKNQPIRIDGHWFPSRKEAKRYGQLKILANARKIDDLKLQVKFPLAINGILITTYIADFTYLRDGILIVEDTKGFKTPTYSLKHKLFRALHGFDITEI